jgi:hypothetical protein
LDEVILNLSDININQPKQCETDFCYEESSVVVTVKKIWKPLSSIINDNSLKSWEFAKEFKDINDN